MPRRRAPRTAGRGGIGRHLAIRVVLSAFNGVAGRRQNFAGYHGSGMRQGLHAGIVQAWSAPIVPGHTAWEALLSGCWTEVTIYGSRQTHRVLGDVAIIGQPVWLAPGEQIVHEIVSKNKGVFYPWEGASISITNARVVMFPPPGGRIHEQLADEINRYCQMIELVDVRDYVVKEGRSSSRLELVIMGPRPLTIEDKTPLILEFAEALRTALVSRIALVRFADPQEKILFRPGDPNLDVRRDDVSGIESDVWRKTFVDGRYIWSARAKPCVTNRRILFYRVNNIAISGGVFQTAPPDLLCVQVPLEHVTRVYEEEHTVEAYSPPFARCAANRVSRFPHHTQYLR